jgi:hypothetical protein
MRILVLVIASDSPAYYVEMQKVWIRRCTAEGSVRCSGCTCGDAFGGVRRCMTDGHVRCTSGVRCSGCTCGVAFGSVRCTCGVTSGVRCTNSDIVDVWFVKAKPARLWVGDIANDGPLSDTVEFDRDAMTIYVKGEETYIPGILNKTIEAIRAIGLDYDFVWRTNLSSVLDFDGLIRYCNGVVEQREAHQHSKHSVSSHKVLQHREVLYESNKEVLYESNKKVLYESNKKVLYESNKKVLYAGYIGLAPIEAEFDSHIRFASGSGFLLAREAVEYLLDKVKPTAYKESLLRRDLIDDVAIGALLEPQFGIVHLDRCRMKTGDENISRMVELGIFHFRCETYQHERTVEFMNKVDRGLSQRLI